MRIPKKIYQTWHTRNFHPLVEKEIQEMKEMNSDFEFVLFTDGEMDAYVADNFPPDIVKAYNMLNIMAARADFWRYLILFRDGGVYLDIDSSITRPLRELIGEDDSAIISFEGSPNICLQWCLMFEKYHPILDRCIAIVTENILQNKYPNDLMRMTGPYVFTQAVTEIHAEYFNGEEFPFGGAETDTVFENDREGGGEKKIKYRIYKIDFGDFCEFQSKYNRYLYLDRDKWKGDLRRGVPLLRDAQL